MNDIGIDLGTVNTLIYKRGEGIVLFEPSVVCINRQTNKIILVGEEARKIIGRTPANVEVVKPMKGGVIANLEIVKEMLLRFLSKAQNKKSFLRPRVAIGIPSIISDIEKKSVKEAVEQSGARKVFLIEEPVAAGIGANINIYEPKGNMVLDIGGGTTEIAVISMGGVVISNSIRTASQAIDESIIHYLKKNYYLWIGEQTAEELKIKVGLAIQEENELFMEARGRDIGSGLPKSKTIGSNEIYLALKEVVNSILDLVISTLENIPPELSSDILENGIVMTGGGSLLKNLDKFISEKTGIPVRVDPDPLRCVVFGLGKCLEDINLLEKIKL
ncbi:rod shape-determining protein [bacterium]|nr:rod shape-determining protein [bacterium]MBU1781786.1 rod shape-determining protein [bacterium]